MKLDFAIYRHFMMQEAAKSTFEDPLPDYDELEESKRVSMRHNKWKLKQDPLSNEDHDLYDYDELVKKEIPELSKIQKEEVIEYMKNEYSSQYANSKAKLQKREDMSVEPPLKLQTPDDIKKAIQRIITYQKKTEVADVFAAPLAKESGKAMMPPTPKIKRSEVKQRVGHKQPMTISKFQEYMGWYEKQSNSGKYSYSNSKSSMKKPTPAIGRR